MKKNSIFLAILFSGILLLSLLSITPAVTAQQPTISVPTVTGTVSGPVAVVIPGSETRINLRSGPGGFYDRVGVMEVGEKRPALGQSPKGEWIQVEYHGVPGGKAWISSIYVEIQPPQQLPIVEPPATPTPLVTPTIDLTLAAKFVVTVAPTRLPTFTEPAPLSIPTFTGESLPGPGSIPVGVIILILIGLGLFLGIIAFTQSR